VGVYWIGVGTSYLSDRWVYVRSGSTRSRPTLLRFGIPQGSVLGPILFLLYTAGIIDLIQEHQLLPHLYADDTAVWFLSSRPDF